MIDLQRMTGMTSENEIKLINILLEYLNKRGVLSDLEKDILSTIEKYTEIPFDRNDSEKGACHHEQIVNGG